MSKQLLNKTITDILLNVDTTSLLVRTTEGDITADAYGDCCSHSWIESVELPARGFPAVVTAVEGLDMPDLGDLPGCDVVRYYGLKIVTDNGDIIIDYRNDSNGYYGGSLDWNNIQPPAKSCELPRSGWKKVE